jgi:hypothetical protein
LINAGCGVEGLGHRHDGRIGCIQAIDQLGKVGKRSRQAVDLVDDDLVNQSLVDERYRSWSVSVPEVGGNLGLALMGLTEATSGLVFGFPTAQFGYCERDLMSDCSV